MSSSSAPFHWVPDPQKTEEHSTRLIISNSDSDNKNNKRGTKYRNNTKDKEDLSFI